MAKICTTEKTARRQEWMENGLLTLMEEKRFEEITVTDLCRYLNLSRRSFYRYFRDLEDVLDSALSHVFQNMAVPEGLPEMGDLQKNYEFWMAHRPVLDALHHSGMLDKLYEFTFRFTSFADISKYLEEEDRSLWRETGQFAVSGSVSLVIFWYQNGFQKTPEEMARITYRLLFSPILHKK